MSKQGPIAPKQTWIDRHGAKRTVPMEILCLGLSRTGTFSLALKVALLQLGYGDVYHMSSTIENPPDCDMWLEAIDAKFYGKGEEFGREQWDQLLGHVTAVSDAPATAFARELLEAYPDAKVIITTRSETAWYRSASGSIGNIYPDLYSWSSAFIRLFDATQRRRDAMMRKFVPAYWGPLGQIPGSLKGRMTRHNDEVKQFIAGVEKKTGKKRQVLEYRVEEGWGPLCKFLGKDARKDTPFPRINNLESFQALVAALKKMAFQRAMQRAAFWAAGVIGLAACAWAISNGRVDNAMRAWTKHA